MTAQITRLSSAKKTSRSTDQTVTALGTWMTMAQVCDLLCESRSTIDKWRARGLFPDAVRKPNGSLMFRRDDVADFILGLERAA